MAKPKTRNVPLAGSPFDALMETAPEFMVVLDANLQVLRASAALCRVTETSSDGGWSFLDSVERFSAARLSEALGKLMKGSLSPDPIEVFHQDPAGESIRTEYTWVVWPDESGDPKGLTGIGRRTPKVADEAELARIREELERAYAALERRGNEIARLRGQLQGQSSRDSLTELGNRRFVMDRLDSEMARAFRYNQPLTVLLIDVDHMNDINEAHGQERGDEVLRQLAEIIQEQVRTTDTAARFGGEEFLVLCPHTDRTNAHFLAERLRTRVAEQAFSGDEREFSVTISVGLVSVSPKDDTTIDVDDVIQAADQALESAKRGGMNRVRLLEMQ